MGFRGVLLKVGIFVLLVAILPGLPPYPTFPFKAFSVPPPRPLEDVLAPNQLLNNAERLLENQLRAPETILVRGNTTFVSVFGGRILEISNGDQIRVITKFGAECRGTFDERECGRPLGMAFDTQGNNLIVAESYSGLWQVQIKTGERKLLVSRDEVLDGIVPRKARIPLGVTVARNGDLYWTDMASDADFENTMQAMLMNPSGRLMHYSRDTGKNRLLIDQVFGANGVALNRDESFVLVAELGGQLIRRYYLKGTKTGTDDIFIDGLPGAVDNLVADEHGLWAAIFIGADLDHPSLLAMLAPYPSVRKLAVRLLTMLDLPFEFIYQKTGNTIALRIANFIGNLASSVPLFPKRGTVLRLDWEGNILAALHGDDGTANLICHAIRSGDYLLLGSPMHHWIRRVRLTEEVLRIVAPKGGPKVTVPKVTSPKQQENVKQEFVPPPRPLEDVLAPNQLLNNAEHLLENQLLGPETILVRGNTTFVSVFGGQILEISNGDQIRVITKFGAECRGTFDERECGRPLGIAFDTQGNNLIVAEPYSGLWQVQIKTGERKLLVSLDEVLDGVVPRKARIPNGVTVARNGDIYWSDTASNADFENTMQAMLMNPSGRLMHYSRATGKNRMLIDQVFGANGIALNRDESFVLVAELGGQLIRRYYLKGTKTGTDDIFIDGLPGSVDNLVADEHGLWAAIVIGADLDHPSPLAMLAPFPTVRKLAVRLLTMLDLPFEFIYQKTGNTIALRVANFIGNLGSSAPLFPKRGTVLRLDWEGNILAALHSDDGSANLIAHAVRSGDHLLLGSPMHPWIGRVRLTEETLRIVAPQGGPTVTVPKVTPPKQQGKVKKEL